MNPKAQGGDTSVDEDDLLAGRGAGESEGSDRSDSTTMGDFFTISSPDGIHSLAIGGTAFITEDVFTAGSITTPLGNTLTIISYDSGTGEIAYSYTLNDNTETHPTADGENDIFEDFAVVLTDQDLQEANDILSVQVVDDVPTANDDGTIAVGEDMPVKIDALFNDVFGADGVDTDNNPDIVVSVTSQGSKGTTTYDPVTGLFTYTPFALEVGADNFTYTIIDGDGDESTATVDLMLAPDSTPMIGDPSNVEVDEDGFRFANKDTTPPQTNETTSTESLTGAGEVKVKFGNDVPDPADLLTSIVLKTTGLDAQMLMTLDMQLIEFAPDGDDIVGSVANPTSFGTTEVIRIEITGATLTDAATGEVTYTYLITLAQPIKHDAGNGENFETLFGIPFEVTDSDGSMAIGSFNAVVYDDVPVLLDQGPATVDVHEDALDQTAGTAAGNNPDDDDSTGNLEAGKTDSAVFNYAALAALVNVGADEDAVFSLSGDSIDGDPVIAGGLPASSNGDPITWNVLSSTVVQGVAGGRVIFDLTHDNNGTPDDPSDDTFTFNLNDQIDHPIADGDDSEELAIDLTAAFAAVTDADGDPLDLTAGSILANVEDDVPELNDQASPATVDVHEDALDQTAGTAAGNNPDDDDSTGNLEAGKTDSAVFNYAALAALVNVGADEDAVFSLSGDSIDGDPVIAGGLPASSNGDPITWNVLSSTVVQGVAGGRVIFDLTHDNNGTPDDPSDDTFTFNLNDQIDHPIADGDDSEELAIDLTAAFAAVTDADGDPLDLTAGSILANVEDDVPELNDQASPATVDVHEDALDQTAGTAAGNNPDDDDSTGNLEAGKTDSAVFNYAALAALVNVGADEDAVFSLSGDSIDGDPVIAGGLPASSNGDPITWNVLSSTVVQGVAGGRVIFDLTHDNNGTPDDPSDDTFTFNLNDQIDHPIADGDDSEELAIDLTAAFAAVTDADGDPLDLTAGSILANVEDDVPELNDQASPATVDVHEDALDQTAGTAAGNNPDDDDSTGNLEAGKTDSAVFNYAALAALVNVGADEDAVFSLSGDSIDGDPVIAGGLPASSNGDPITWNVLSSTVVQGVAGGRVIFDLTHDNNGTPDDPSDDTFTFNLNDQIDHPIADGDDSEELAIDLTAAFAAVTDADGDPLDLTAGSILANVEDDVPVTVVTEDASLTNAAGAAILFDLDTDNLDLSDNYGADEGTVRFNDSLHTADSGLTYNGSPIIYTVSGGGLILSADSGGTHIFTVTLNPVTAQYSIDMDNPVDAVTNINFTEGADFVGGNPAWNGFVPTGQFSTPVDDDSKDILLTPSEGGVLAGTVNTNANAGGISAGNSVGSPGGGGGTPETFRVDFVTDLRGTANGDYTNPADRDHIFDGHYPTNGASANFASTGGSTVNFAIFNDDDSGVLNVIDDGAQVDIKEVLITWDGVSETVNILALTVGVTSNVPVGDTDINIFGVTRNADGSVDISGIEGGNATQPDTLTRISVFGVAQYNSIEYTHVTGDTFKIGGFGAAVPSDDPVEFDLPIEVVDGDGDAVDSNINVTLTPTPPVVLDLDGDGVETLNLSDSSVLFDYDGDGTLEHTAWVGADDGLLAIDLNGDGKVNDGSEIVFSQYADGAETDLEGLAMAFDTNQDGQLTAADEQFDKFGVWQDADSDGVTDEGEFTSLTDLGIESINLTNDGNQSVSEDGSVTTFGYSQFTNADGSTGLVGDVAFANYTQDQIDDTIADGLDGDNSSQDAQTYVIDGAAAAEIIAEFQAGIDEIDLSDILTLASDTDVEVANVVHYNSDTGDLSVDAAGNASNGGGEVVANVGTGLGDETIKILFSDGNGGTDTDVV